ncbi:MAG: hypothetical protein COB02_01790 [Candidatus Cloacimonadota bacterium]|nr:MAG: hypothetical protein COB02_01790 [Candidatus Cloacimonadota bacterium]
MLKKLLICPLAIGCIFIGTNSAFDVHSLNTSMHDLSAKLKTTIISSQDKEQMKKDAVIRKEVQAIVSSIESVDDLFVAKKVAVQYSTGNPADKLAANLLLRALKKKALFLGVNDAPKAPLIDLDGAFNMPISNPVDFLRPEEFISIDVPAAEAVVYIDAKKYTDRVASFEGILQRHECDTLSKYINKKGDDSYNYYVSCKQFVIEEIVHHFDGVVGSDFVVEMELKSGGWLTGKKLEYTFKPSSKEKSSFHFFKAVVEKDPFVFLHNEKLVDLNEIGKVKDIAGKSTLILKNARVKMWVKAPGADRTQAIYFSEEKFGDIQMRGEK